MNCSFGNKNIGFVYDYKYLLIHFTPARTAYRKMAIYYLISKCRIAFFQ